MWLPCKIKNMSLTTKPVLKMLGVMVHIPIHTMKTRTTGAHWLASLAYLVSAREELASKTNGQPLSNILQQHVHMYVYICISTRMCSCICAYAHTYIYMYKRKDNKKHIYICQILTYEKSRSVRPYYNVESPLYAVIAIN